MFGVENLKILDGGRLRWADEGRELVTEVPKYPQGNITVRERDDSRIRAFRAEVEQHVKRSGKLVDVRSPEEYRGERLHMPEYPNEGALRGGHIPGAKSIPWGRAVTAETHTFKPAAELRRDIAESRPGCVLLALGTLKGAVKTVEMNRKLREAGHTDEQIKQLRRAIAEQGKETGGVMGEGAEEAAVNSVR